MNFRHIKIHAKNIKQCKNAEKYNYCIFALDKGAVHVGLWSYGHNLGMLTHYSSIAGDLWYDMPLKLNLWGVHFWHAIQPEEYSRLWLVVFEVMDLGRTVLFKM